MRFIFVKGAAAATTATPACKNSPFAASSICQRGHPPRTHHAIGAGQLSLLARSALSLLWTGVQLNILCEGDIRYRASFFITPMRLIAFHSLEPIPQLLLICYDIAVSGDGQLAKTKFISMRDGVLQSERVHTNSRRNIPRRTEKVLYTVLSSTSTFACQPSHHVNHHVGQPTQRGGWVPRTWITSMVLIWRLLQVCLPEDLDR